MKRSELLRIPRLPIGARSVLFGAHCWFIHPFFVAAAWWKLYGFPKDWRLWLYFFVHDLGYLFQWCPNMDGPEGEEHPRWGFWFVYRVVRRVSLWKFRRQGYVYPEVLAGAEATRWARFCLYHSRFLAKRYGKPFSCLCVADKLAMCMEPWWLYLPRVWASGELAEYMELSARRRSAGEKPGNAEGLLRKSTTPREWHRGLVAYIRAWVEEHKDGREDTWTPATVETRR